MHNRKYQSPVQSMLPRTPEGEQRSQAVFASRFSVSGIRRLGRPRTADRPAGRARKPCVKPASDARASLAFSTSVPIPCSTAQCGLHHRARDGGGYGHGRTRTEVIASDHLPSRPSNAIINPIATSRKVDQEEKKRKKREREWQRGWPAGAVIRSSSSADLFVLPRTRCDAMRMRCDVM